MGIFTNDEKCPFVVSNMFNNVQEYECVKFSLAAKFSFVQLSVKLNFENLNLICVRLRVIYNLV